MKPRGWIAACAGVAGLIALGAFGWLDHIQYFDGPVFVPIAAVGVPASQNRGLAAVLLSGDMGFHIGMGRQVAARLAGQSMDVLGVDSRAYFRTARRPDEARWLVATAIRRTLRTTHADRLILVGQSFGADMLQVGLSDLDPELRRRIAFVVLVVPGDTVDFKASPLEVLDLVPPDGPALPTAAKLDWVPGLCIYGIKEADSLCPLLRQPNIRMVALQGGHPLKRDPAAVFGAIWRAFGATQRATR